MNRPPICPANAPAPRTVRRWSAFIGWLLVGAGYALGVIGIASIGLLVLPVAVAATVVLARRSCARSGLGGLVVGLGLPPLYIAYLNRSGPGNICTSISGGYSCDQELNRWPWVVAGVVLIGAGLFAFLTRAARIPRGGK